VLRVVYLDRAAMLCVLVYGLLYFIIFYLCMWLLRLLNIYWWLGVM